MIALLPEPDPAGPRNGRLATFAVAAVWGLGLLCLGGWLDAGHPADHTADHTAAVASVPGTCPAPPAP